MATSKGVIQRYTGVAAVDSKHQVIVNAQAHGTGSKQELLLPSPPTARSAHQCVGAVGRGARYRMAAVWRLTSSASGCSASARSVPTTL
jgi:hypothetical protein